MKLKLPVQQFEPPVEQPLTEARITGGMNSYLDPADIPNSQATVLANARTSADFTRRAPGVFGLAGADLFLLLQEVGSNIVGPFVRLEDGNGIYLEPNIGPDGKPVLMFTQWNRFDGTTVLIRFSEDRLDRYSSGTWSQITGTLNGTAKDGIRFVQTADASNDYFIFTNNGADKIQQINSGATSFSALSSSTTINTKYKYICAFFNRIVGANRAASSSSPSSSANPVLIGWSGDFNFTEWNPANDISAGSTPLVEAQSDYADPITGLFGFASVMLILRERSLWTATKRPVASNPFAFQAAFPYVGCDTPSSAVQTRNGIVWYDYRTNQVYSYEVGSSPQPIGNPIKNTLFDSITDRDLVWGSYDPATNTYYLTVPSTTTTNSRIFLFNFNTGSWSYDDREGAYGFYPVDGGPGRLNYDQITGTYAQLTAGVADYNAIGITAATPTVNYIGYSNGAIRYEIEFDRNSQTFNWTSKVYRLPADDMMIARLMVLFEPIRSGAFTVQYKKNNGNWVNYRDVYFEAIDGRTREYFTKLVRANEYQWRIISGAGDFKLLEYKIDISASKEDKSQ